MITTRKLAAVALTASLLIGTADAAFAQAPGGGTTTANRTDDRHTDWSWLGLLGLIGLAGLIPRNRRHDGRP
jgi:hypothetical protein